MRDLHRRPQRSETAAFEKSRDEAFVLDLANGTYFHLDEVAAFVWERLDGASELGTIADEIVARWDVERERAEADLVQLVDELVASGLARVPVE